MTGLLALVGLLGCGSPEPGPQAPPSEPPAAEEVASPASSEAEALEAAEAAAKKLGSTLKARVVQVMGEGGPAAAITVCADEAQGLTAQVAGESRARVGRSSLRLRNPVNAGPDWVTAWLEAQGERKAEGVLPHKEVADGHARVVFPIAIEGPCVACHGPAEQIPAEVREVLASRYPQDAATGYAVGDLRGALWAEVPVK